MPTNMKPGETFSGVRVMPHMTRSQAEWLAADLGDGYSVRKVRGRWVVWCDASDHAVEIDDADRLWAQAQGE